MSTDEYCGLKILLMGLVAAAPRVFIDIDSDSGEKKGVACERFRGIKIESTYEIFKRVRSPSAT